MQYNHRPIGIRDLINRPRTHRFIYCSASMRVNNLANHRITMCLVSRNKFSNSSLRLREFLPNFSNLESLLEERMKRGGRDVFRSSFVVRGQRTGSVRPGRRLPRGGIVGGWGGGEKRIFGRECTVLMLQVAAHSGGLALQWRCLHPL